MTRREESSTATNPQAPPPPTDYYPRPTVPAQYSAPGPTGVRVGEIDAALAMEVGAHLRGLGMEQSVVQTVLALMQENAIKASMASLPALLAKLGKVQQARLARVHQAIRDLPAVAFSQGGGLFSTRAVQTANYVSQDAVLNVIQMAMIEVPTA